MFSPLEYSTNLKQNFDNLTTRYIISPNISSFSFVKPKFNLSYLRRFSFSETLKNFDEEIEKEPIPYKKENENLLEQYLNEEECDRELEKTKMYDEEENKQMTIPLPSNQIISFDVIIDKPLVERLSDEKRAFENETIREETKENLVKKPSSPIEQKEKNEINSHVSDFLCNCKKSKCLKLYCECFAKGKLCNPLCNCLDCSNKKEDCEKRKLALRNTYLKSRKNEKDGEEAVEMDIESFTLPNINPRNLGCNCKKSHCKKKYCECFDSGKPCGDHCKCEGCRNYLGVKVKRKEKARKINNEININSENLTANKSINIRSKQRNQGKSREKQEENCKDQGQISQEGDNRHINC